MGAGRARALKVNLLTYISRSLRKNEMQTKTKGAPLRRALKSRMSTSTIHTSYHVHVCLKRIAYTFCKSPYNIFSWLGQLPYWPEPLWSTAGRTGLKFQHQPVLPFHTSTPSQKNAGKCISSWWISRQSVALSHKLLSWWQNLPQPPILNDDAGLNHTQVVIMLQ